MLRIVDSFLTAVLLLILVPFIVFSVVRSLAGLAGPPMKTKPSHPSRQSGIPASEPAGEFHFDRAVEAYENLIDTVIAERRA